MGALPSPTAMVSLPMSPLSTPSALTPTTPSRPPPTTPARDNTSLSPPVPSMSLKPTDDDLNILEDPDQNTITNLIYTATIPNFERNPLKNINQMFYIWNNN